MMTGQLWQVSFEIMDWMQAVPFYACIRTLWIESLNRVGAGGAQVRREGPIRPPLYLR